MDITPLYSRVIGLDVHQAKISVPVPSSKSPMVR